MVLRSELSRIEQQPSKLWVGRSNRPERANFNAVCERRCFLFI